MTKYTLLPADKIIIKDGTPEIFDDDNFWSNYSDIHAIQVDTSGTSEKENLDGSIGSVSQEEIDAIENKYTSVKNTRETNEAADRDAHENSWARIRLERDQALKATDKYLISDYPITSEDKTSMQTYRTSLRNIPDTYSTKEPRNITFDADGNVSVDGSVVITIPTMGGGE